MKVLAISFAKRALETGSREQERMIAYGSQFEAFHLIVLTDESDHLPESFTTGTVQIYGTNSRSKWGKLRRAITLGRQVCAEAPGEWVVSSQDPFETSFIARRIISAVGGGVHQVQLHGDFYGAGPWVSESFSNRLRAWYGRLVLRDARKIRVVSERIKQSLIAIGVEEQKIVVLPVAVSLEPFLAIGQARLTPEGDVPHRFMFVGRFAPEKRIEEILSAARLLHAHAAAFELTVVGDGPLRATLSNLIATYGLENVVHIKPWTNDLPALLAEADTLVLASAHEGYALVLIEAMAAGLPVITTNVGCVGECVHDGIEGQVVAGDANSIGAAMQRYITDPAVHQTHARAAHMMAQKIEATQVTYLTQWRDSFLPDEPV